jgi:hypothetical protein
MRLLNTGLTLIYVVFNSFEYYLKDLLNAISKTTPYIYLYMYGISADMKIKTDIIASITASPVGRVVKIYAETF